MCVCVPIAGDSIHAQFMPVAVLWSPLDIHCQIASCPTAGVAYLRSQWMPLEIPGCHCPTFVRSWDAGFAFGFPPLTRPKLALRLCVCVGGWVGGRGVITVAVIHHLSRALSLSLSLSLSRPLSLSLSLCVCGGVPKAFECTNRIIFFLFRPKPSTTVRHCSALHTHGLRQYITVPWYLPTILAERGHKVVGLLGDAVCALPTGHSRLMAGLMKSGTNRIIQPPKPED